MRAALAATFTPTASATATETPAPTFTPTLTPTPTATPASPAEWAERYYDLMLEGLNTLSVLDFSADRAGALAQRLAQEQGLTYVPASYFELSAEPWAAFVASRTPDGVPLPMFFWRSAETGNQVEGQILTDAVAALADPETGYTPLVTGISQGALRTDAQGISHIVTVDRPEARGKLTAYVWSQTLPGSNFEVVWRSDDDPQWTFRAVDTSVALEEDPDRALPDLLLSGPLPADSAIRTEEGAAGIFIEQAPFAQQRLQARWQPSLASDSDPNAPALLTGYRLAQVEVQPTPLSALATILAWLQDGQINSARPFVARIDLLTDMFNLGLATPGDWMAVYVNDLDREIQDGGQSLRLRFFDNADRNRTYEAIFEQNADSGRYVLQSISPVILASTAGLVTPAPPRPTSTPTATPLPQVAAWRHHAHRAALRRRRGAGRRHPQPHAGADGIGHADLYADANRHADRHTHAQRDAAADRHADADAHGHRDAHGHADGEAAAHPGHPAGDRRAADRLHAAHRYGPPARRAGRRVYRHCRAGQRYAGRHLRHHRGL